MLVYAHVETLQVHTLRLASCARIAHACEQEANREQPEMLVISVVFATIHTHVHAACGCSLAAWHDATRRQACVCIAHVRHV